MARRTKVISQLITESHELEELGERVQGERELQASSDELRLLTARYLDWLGRALATLPEDLRERFRSEYEGSWLSSKIKKFLESPGETNPFWNPENVTPLITYWLNPYDKTFRAPLLAQRQILAEAQRRTTDRSRLVAAVGGKVGKWAAGILATVASGLILYLLIGPK